MSQAKICECENWISYAVILMPLGMWPMPFFWVGLVSLSLYYSCLTLDQPFVNFIIFGNLTTTSFYLVINASPVLIKHQLNTICLSKTYFSFLVYQHQLKHQVFITKEQCVLYQVSLLVKIVVLFLMEPNLFTKQCLVCKIDHVLRMSFF